LEDVLRTFYQSELKDASPRWLSRLRLPRLTSGRRHSPTRPSNPER